VNSQARSEDQESRSATQAGRFIRDARSRVGISQRELARRSGVPGPVISAIERSRRQPSVPTMAKLLRGLDLELRLEAAPAHAPPPRIDDGVPMAVSTRHVGEAERRRAHEVFSALDLANRISRARREEDSRGVR
jgi:transcriptional regulator with XRE-family HTH domain